MKGVHCNMTDILTFRPVKVVCNRKSGGVFCADNVTITTGCMLVALDKITIGKGTALAFGTTIITTANPNNTLNDLYPATRKPVTIGENCWLCANSTVLPGVTIGDRVVVAAGAVVTKDVPSGVLVGGVPARIIKYL